MQNNQPTAPASVRFQDFATVASILTGVTVVAALYLAREVLIPIALALLISFVLAPLALALRRLGLPRVPAVIAVVAFAFGAILGVGVLGTAQLSQLADKLPQYQSNISEKIRALIGTTTTSGTVTRATSVLKEIGQEITKSSQSQIQPPREGTPVPVEIRPPVSNPLKVAIDFLLPLLSPLASTGLVVLFVIFILLQQEDLRDRVIRLLGTRELHRTTEVMDEATARLSRYFLLQTLLNAGFGIVVGVALWIIGVPSPLLWGIFAMLMRFVPYIGSILAAVLPVALAAAVDPGWTMVAWTIALFLIGEPLMGHIVEPIVFGQHTGLSPVAIVIAATFWTWLWGPIGLILATPLTLCLVVLGQYTTRLEFLHVLLGDQPALSPAESFYQRLIAGDPAEIIEQAESHLQDCDLVGYYETVALPGLALAQRDMVGGELSPERQALLAEGVAELIEGLSEYEVPTDTQPAEDTKLAGSVEIPFDGRETGRRQPESLLKGRVLCVGGRGAVDQAAATLLVQLLRCRGIGAELGTVQGDQGIAARRENDARMELVCVCYVGTARSAQVRLLIRRLRRRFPFAKTVLGLWRMPLNTTALLEIKASAGSDLFALSLKETVDHCAAELRLEMDGKPRPSDNQSAARRDNDVADPDEKQLDPSSQTS